MSGSEQVASTVSGENGSFSFSDVAVGSYQVVVELSNQCFSGETSKTVSVEAEKTANAYFGFEGICD